MIEQIKKDKIALQRESIGHMRMARACLEKAACHVDALNLSLEITRAQACLDLYIAEHFPVNQESEHFPIRKAHNNGD